MSGEVQFVPGGGMIGYRHRKISKVVEGVSSEETEHQEGAILAFRKGGDEVLFAAAGVPGAKAEGAPEDELPEREDRKVPLAWIPVGEFSANQIAVATEEDFDEEELVEVPHAGHGPLPQRTVGIRRREG